ncbi:hypothetical protein FIBSPDRAFT_1035686 [Athelia psychrophila]|uniref:Ricin B lectin domain-containing protein n=1 Tax=Athelia psychrophila TaxID=1759441 RepID=A0A166XEK7_9AGAM|nr:hypothetical protein FIBSPDRAFT_1035686 [Fibularhizoctonia sp. CBS 109695]
MSLPTGLYIIKHQPSGKVVSRNIREDLSLRPKQVLVLPDGIDDPYTSTWVVESLGSGNYHFSNKGGTASVIKGKIYANLLPSLGNDVWQVKAGSGPNVFQITNSEGLNWGVPVTEDFSQVAVSPSPDYFVITPFEQ